MMVVEEQGYAVFFYLIFFPVNAISASAAALLVHHTVALEQLIDIDIDGGYLFSIEIPIFDAVFQLRLRKFRNAPSGRS